MDIISTNLEYPNSANLVIDTKAGFINWDIIAPYLTKDDYNQYIANISLSNLGF